MARESSGPRNRRTVIVAAVATGLLLVTASGAVLWRGTVDDIQRAAGWVRPTGLAQPSTPATTASPESCPVRSTSVSGVAWAVEAAIPMTEPVASQGFVVVRVNGDTLGKGCVVGVEAASGRILWTVPAWTGLGSPLTAGGVVLAAVDFGIVALDLRTGVERWSVGRTEPSRGPRPQTDALPPVVRQIAVAGDVVIALSHDDVTAYFIQTGQKAWQEHLPNAYSMVLGDGVVFAHELNPETLVALEAANGTERWHRSGRIQPDVASKELLIGYLNSRYYAISTVDGSTLWEVEAPGGNAFKGSVLANGLVVFPVDGPAGSVYAVDARTGRTAWRVDVGQRESFHPSMPVLGSSLFMSAPDAFLALDPSTGQERWRQTIDGDLSSQLLVTPDVVYVGGAAGSLFAFDAQKGTVLGRGQAGGGIRGSVVRNDDLIVATRSGTPGPPESSAILVALRVP